MQKLCIYAHVENVFYICKTFAQMNTAYFVFVKRVFNMYSSCVLSICACAYYLWNLILLSFVTDIRTQLFQFLATKIYRDYN